MKFQFVVVIQGKLALVATYVSSKMVKAYCAKKNIMYTETHTGFKNVGNAVLSLEAKGYTVPFAYEEAIGNPKRNLIQW